MKGKKKRKISLSIVIFIISIHFLFFIPTAWANSQIGISFDPRPNEPPSRSINIYPSDGATDIEIPITLQVSVYDESSSTVDVYFYNGLDNASIGVDYDVSADWSIATVIWSGLQDETNYSWYAVANDSEYENTSQIWTFTTESSYTPPPPPIYYGGAESGDDPPTISDIYHEPTKVTSYDPVYVYANVTDDYSVKLVTLYWNDGSDHSKSMTPQDENIYYAQIGPFLDGITVMYSIDATDYCGASHIIQSVTKSFTVVAEPIIEIVIENISSGETIELTPENSDEVGIDSIHFTPAIDLTDVKITVEKLTGQPEGTTTAPTGFIYAYMKIELTADNESIGEDEIKSLNITFKVNLTWITENNIDKETITLTRHYNNEWQNLTTTILFDHETCVHYEAETNGLSIFAIVGNEVIEPPEAEEERIQFLLLIALIALITTIILTTASIHKQHKRRRIYYLRKLLSRLRNQNSKEIKKRKTKKSQKSKRKTGTKSKKKKLIKNNGKVKKQTNKKTRS